MQNYTVYGTKTELISIQVKANSHKEAIGKAVMKYYDFNSDDVESDDTYEKHDNSLQWDRAFNDDDYES